MELFQSGFDINDGEIMVSATTVLFG